MTTKWKFRNHPNAKLIKVVDHISGCLWVEYEAHGRIYEGLRYQTGECIGSELSGDFDLIPKAYYVASFIDPQTRLPIAEAGTNREELIEYVQRHYKLHPTITTIIEE